MPGNEVEDRYHNLYQLEKSFREQNSSEVFGGNWLELDQNSWAQNLTQIGAPQNPNLKNYSVQQLDSVKGCRGEFFGVPFDQTHALRPEYLKDLALFNTLDKNDFLFGRQNFETKQSCSGSFRASNCYDQQSLNSRGISIFKSQHENECGDSPTLTTNSERSEITEASGDLNFFRGQEQLVLGQQLGNLNFHPMQQSGYNDMQLLQQHMMLKQLQEFQRQQQLQQLGEARQQNSLGHLSSIAKQGAGSQFSNIINGTPVNDSPQMLRGWMQRGASPAAQGMSNKVMFSQEQAQALHAMGLAPQQNDGSLYGTPISNARGNMSQYQNIQGMSDESVNLFAKASNQAQKSTVQSPGFGNPYLGNVPSDLVGFPEGSLELKQGLQAKDTIEQVPIQSLNSGLFPGNLNDGSSARANASVKESKDRQDQVGWSPVQQTPKQVDSQNSVPLDPMEAKILYNMDDNIWDAFGGRPDMAAGGFGNMMGHPDSSNAVPSIQSGSWSALMQSAVAEASTSDTGMKEEWSGLTFKNTEHSTENQMLNLMESQNRQTGWVDNNLQSQSASSFTEKSFPLIADTAISSSFPGFQQPGIKQREDLCQDGFRESTGNYKHQQKPSIEEGQRVQTSVHSNNSWAGQMFGHLKRDDRSVASHDVSMENRGNESMGKSHHQMTNGPFVAYNSSEGENQTYEKQQNIYQRGNTNDGFTTQGFGGQDHRQFEQNKIFGNTFMNVRNADKTFLSNFQGNLSASEEIPFRNDQGANTSAALHRSDFHDSSNATTQASENMLELLHKVGNSKDENSIAQLGSTTNYSSLPSAAAVDSHDTSVAQLHTQSSASQGFGLRLAPPSQRLSNSNSFFPPQGLPTVSNQNSGPSFESMPLSSEQRAQWDSRSGNSGHAGLLNSVSSLTPNLSYSRNQLQTSTSNVPVVSQPWKPSLPGSTSRYPPFDQTPSQDALQQIYASSGSQQFPVLEASAVSQPSNVSSVSQQSEGSPKPQNVWRNIPTQRRPLSTEPTKLSAGLSSFVGLSNSRTINTSWTPHGLHNQNSAKAGYKPSEFGASSNSQGLDYEEEHQGSEMQQHNNACSNISHRQEPISDASVHVFSSLESHQQQDLDSAKHDNNAGASCSDRNLGEIDHSHGHHRSIATLHQLHALNNSSDAVSEVHQATALGEEQARDNEASRFKQPMDNRPNSGLRPNSFQGADSKLRGFIAGARDSASIKASLQPALQARPSQEMGIHDHNESQAQSSGSNVPFNHSNHSPVNLHMASSLFKQYGTHRNGQMVPVSDPSFAKMAATRFSLGRPQVLHSQNLERLDASGAGQVGKVWSSTATTLVAGQHLPAPFVSPSEASNQVAITRPKKRKFAPSLCLPWHKELSQESRSLENISVSEEGWAHATNRLIEKVDYNEMIEDLQPRLRSKRRLILTTQLMQHLFSAGPTSVFRKDSASSYHVLSYFTTRLSLGDACSLAYCKRNNNSLACRNNRDKNSEKLNNSEGSGDQQMSEIVEAFIDRAKKLEEEFCRLDMAASIVDIRVDFQELEKFSVINRFAKFHTRGQADSSGTSSSGAPRPTAERYVTAFSMPKVVPEEIQCLSL